MLIGHCRMKRVRIPPRLGKKLFNSKKAFTFYCTTNFSPTKPLHRLAHYCFNYCCNLSELWWPTWSRNSYPNFLKAFDQYWKKFFFRTWTYFWKKWPNSSKAFVTSANRFKYLSGPWDRLFGAQLLPLIGSRFSFTQRDHQWNNGQLFIKKLRSKLQAPGLALDKGH